MEHLCSIFQLVWARTAFNSKCWISRKLSPLVSTFPFLSTPLSTLTLLALNHFLLLSSYVSLNELTLTLLFMDYFGTRWTMVPVSRIKENFNFFESGSLRVLTYVTNLGFRWNQPKPVRAMSPPMKCRIQKKT